MSKISDALARLDFTIGRRDSAVGVLEGPSDQAEAADQAEAEEAQADSEEQADEEPEMELAPVGVNHEAFGSHDEAIAASQKSLTTFAGAKSLPVKNEAVLALWDASKGHKGAAREFDALAEHLDGQENPGAASKARAVAKSHRDAAMQIEKAAIGEEHSAPDAIKKAEAASAELTEKLKDQQRSEDPALTRDWAEWDAEHMRGYKAAKKDVSDKRVTPLAAARLARYASDDARQSPDQAGMNYHLGRARAYSEHAGGTPEDEHARGMEDGKTHIARTSMGKKEAAERAGYARDYAAHRGGDRYYSGLAAAYDAHAKGHRSDVAMATRHLDRIETRRRTA